MTKKITIMTGSVREGNVSEKLLPIVQEELTKRDDVVMRVANLREMALPFVDTPVSPMSEGYEPNHKSVREWRYVVTQSDAFIMLTPEYNYQPSPVQMNAIDWLKKDWEQKPVTIISYGWSGGLDAAALLKKLLIKVGATPTETPHELYLAKDISPAGEMLDQNRVMKQIAAAIDEVA